LGLEESSTKAVFLALKYAFCDSVSTLEHNKKANLEKVLPEAPSSGF